VSSFKLAVACVFKSETTPDLSNTTASVKPVAVLEFLKKVFPPMVETELLDKPRETSHLPFVEIKHPPGEPPWVPLVSENTTRFSLPKVVPALLPTWDCVGV
jgi:hypothetical protein